jgi:hypothetical protein
MVRASGTAYRNQYWPAQYIIDQNGKIVFQHDGEGQYEQIDRTILLARRCPSLPASWSGARFYLRQIGNPQRVDRGNEHAKPHLSL